MAINGFKPEEKLYVSAFNSWNARLTAILDENDLDDIVLNVTEEPTTNVVVGLPTRGSKVRLEESFMILSEKN